METKREEPESAQHLASVVLEQDEGGQGEHACEEVEYAALFHWIAFCEQVTQREEDQADNEVRSP